MIVWPAKRRPYALTRTADCAAKIMRVVARASIERVGLAVCLFG